MRSLLQKVGSGLVGLLTFVAIFAYEYGLNYVYTAAGSLCTRIWS